MDARQITTKSVTAVLTLLLITAMASGAVINLVEGFEDGSSVSELSQNGTQAYAGDFSGYDDGVGDTTVELLSTSTVTPDSAQAAVLFETPSPADSSASFGIGSGTSFDSEYEIGSFFVNADGSVSHTDPSTGTQDTGVNLNEDEWYVLRFENINYSDNTLDYVVYKGNGSLVELFRDTKSFQNPSDNITSFSYNAADTDAVGDPGPRTHWDQIGYGAQYDVRGTVTDQTGEPISNALINVTDKDTSTEVANTTTNSGGNYSVTVPEGDYSISATKAGLERKEKNVTVDGGAVFGVNFVLERIQGLEIKSKQYINHSQSIPYTVVYENNSGRFDVTDEATTTSNDTTLVTVNSSGRRFEATDNVSRNNQTFVTAEYAAQGETFAVDRNITVANKTVDNIGVLPPGPRISASFGDQAIQAILIITMLGAATALVGRAFAGLAGMALLFAMAWLGGFIGNGMVIISFLMALFVGLNMAANIDYTVQG